VALLASGRRMAHHWHHTPKRQQEPPVRYPIHVLREFVITGKGRPQHAADFRFEDTEKQSRRPYGAGQRIAIPDVIQTTGLGLIRTAFSLHHGRAALRAVPRLVGRLVWMIGTLVHMFFTRSNGVRLCADGKKTSFVGNGLNLPMHSLS